ncbi:c-type cytochrome biogenesis protein CcmI [Colwellia chukchiensis]|nr:c-type cytochrome biogenesis protein CcmI [Colwellia chukchiensis]
MFWLAIMLLIVIALFIVWRIFSAPEDAIGAQNDNIRQETNIRLYHEHLAQLEQDLADGSIEQDSFTQLKAELDKSLLQDVEASTTTVIHRQEKSWSWPLGIALAIVSFSFFAYMSLGAYEKLNAPDSLTEQEAHQNLNPEQMLAFRLQQLEREVKDDPSNSQAWFSLGQAYISSGEFELAIAAFDRVIEQVGEYAELLGPKAQAMYYKNNQQINSDIQTVIDKALALDALDPATNILLGMNSFSNRAFAQAVHYWEKVLNSGRPGVSVQALQGAIAEAKNQLQLSDEATQGKEVVDANAPQLIVNVSLAESVQAQLMAGDDKTVFIYAIAADGPRMPLAAVKVKASDLPLSVVLNDSQAMTAQMRLSDVDKVHIYAVVSMQGSVGIKPGDYKAEALHVETLEKSPIKIEITEQVQ